MIPDQATALSPRQRLTFVFLLFAGVGACLLFLTWDLRPFPIPAYVDDYRYVLSAHYLKAFPSKLLHHVVPLDWLGPYDPTTLFKRPGFSILLAVLSALHLPFFQTILLLHLVGLAILANGLLRLNYSRTVVGAVFVACGLFPTLYDSNGVRIIREVATGALEVAIFGICLLLFSIKTDRPVKIFFTPTFIALLALLGLHWSMREESVLLLPAVLLLVNGAVWLHGKSGLREKLILAVLGSVLVIAPSQIAYQTFATLNKSSYGVRIVNDLSEGNFPRAVSALKRVDESPCDFQLLSADEVQKVMNVSPSFRTVGIYLANALQSQPEMLYGESFSVLRVSALSGTEIGATPKLTQDLFGRITDEVETACRDGRLRCATRGSGGIVPILCSSQWPLVPTYIKRYIIEDIAKMSHSGISPSWSGMPGVGRMQPSELSIFEEVARQKMAGRNGELVEFSQPATLDVLQKQDFRRHRVGMAFMTVMPWIMAFGTVIFVLRLPSWRSEYRPWWLIVLLAMGGHVAGRVIAFSYLSAVEGYINTRFISISYPIAAAFAVLAAAEVRYLFGRRPSVRAQTKIQARPIWAKVPLWGTAVLSGLVAVGFVYAGARPGREMSDHYAATTDKSDLKFEDGKESFELDGKRIQIVADHQGWLYGEAGWLRGDTATFDGWAMDVAAHGPAQAVLFFVNGHLVTSAIPTVPVPSLEKGFPVDTHAGFSVPLERTVVVGNKVRVFALLPGERAGELNYPPSYPYRN